MKHDFVKKLVSLFSWRKSKTQKTLNAPKRILIANSVAAFQNSAILDSALIRGLTLQGHEVAVVVCDKTLFACLNCKIFSIGSPDKLVDQSWKNSPKACSRCISSQDKYFADCDAVFEISKFLPVDFLNNAKRLLDASTPRDWSINGYPIYEHAFAATARFFAKGKPETEEKYNEVLEAFALASCQTFAAYENIIQNFQPDIMVAHHGIYVPQGPAVEVAKKNGIRVITHTPSYRRGTFIFADGDTYHKVLPKNPLRSSAITEKEYKKTVDYLKSRKNATNDWIWYLPTEKEQTDLREKFSIDASSTVISLFSNVFWDAQIHFDDAVFEDMLSWVKETIHYVQGKEDWHLIIRVHPAEVSGFIPSRQPLADLASDLLQVSKNVHIIDSDDDFDSYRLASESDLCLVYGSKIAGELSALGNKVIVAGEAWAKGKGFTYDATNKEHYFALLENLASDKKPLPVRLQNLAVAYCHQFFFKEMMDVEILLPTNEKAQPFTIRPLSDKEFISIKMRGFRAVLQKIVGADNLHSIAALIPKAEAAVLQDTEEVERACRLAETLTLPSHHDKMKNWDTLLALGAIMRDGNLAPKVWDAGSGAKPVILRWLHQLVPHSDLYACDRVEKPQTVFNELDVEFTIQDMSSTNYPNNFFDYVTSISVIEHGVNVNSFFSEVSRVLKPGGLFLVSTDYWEHKIKTSHKFPYGEKFGPMIVFDKQEVTEMIAHAESLGLILEGNWEACKVKNKVIHWERMDEHYTFAFLAFRKLTKGEN